MRLHNDVITALSSCVRHVYSLYEHWSVWISDWISVFFLNHLLLQRTQWQCKRIDKLHID